MHIVGFIMRKKLVMLTAQVCCLSSSSAWQLYCIETLHLLRHPLIAAVLNTKKRETPYVDFTFYLATE